MPIDFRVWYMRHRPAGSGSLGVHPDDLARLEVWRQQNNHQATWQFVTHPQSGERLNAFQPVAPNQCDRIEARGIRPGDLCTVTYFIKTVGGRAQMWFDRATPLPQPAGQPRDA